ncbi:MAG: hypothetical protein M3178_19240 [Pseudomonadota bacterium]|nr:hypothetical protein [Pseudomonadota bacterium]
MADFAEIALAHSKECRAIDLRIAADTIVQTGMKAIAIYVVPRLIRLVGTVHKHRLRIPIGACSREIIATLNQQDAFAGWRKALRYRRTAGATSDDDDVIMLRHRLQPLVEKPG